MARRQLDRTCVVGFIQKVFFYPGRVCSLRMVRLTRTARSVLYASRPSLLARCFAARRMTTCERRVGDKLGTDDSAFARSSFDGEVYPDLPVVGPGMAHDIDERIRRRVQAAGTDRAAAASSSAPATTTVVVRTVAAQCLDAERVISKIRTSGNLFRCLDPNPHPTVRGALLCVSGGDAARASKEPTSGPANGLKDSRFILGQAYEMRERGEIPGSVDLWAVANPMTDSVDSFRWKVDAGARCFLTQPPFFRERSRSWFETVAATDQARDVDILVGVPMITSLRNLEFWLDLCGVSQDDREARRLKSTLPNVAQETDRAAYIEWNAKFIRETAWTMAGVTGMHVMPVTASGLQMTEEVMRDASH